MFTEHTSTGHSSTGRAAPDGETRDWDAAHRAVADAYFPHELTDLDGTGDVALSLRTVELGGVTIGRLTWGTDVAITCAYPGTYEVNIPMSGRLHSRHETREVVSTPGRATVFAADRESQITRWTADCDVIGVKFDADHLEREADRIHVGAVRRRLVLPARSTSRPTPGDRGSTSSRRCPPNIANPSTCSPIHWSGRNWRAR